MHMAVSQCDWLLSERHTGFWKLPSHWRSIKLQQNSRIWIIQSAPFTAGCRSDSGFCVCAWKTDNTDFSLSGTRMTHTSLEWSKPAICCFLALRSCRWSQMETGSKGLLTRFMKYTWLCNYEIQLTVIGETVFMKWHKSLSGLSVCSGGKTKNRVPVCRRLQL